MVKRCSWGMCRSDTRYPERLVGGVKFIPFPKWKKTMPSNREKCLRWIKACNRPHEQLNLSLVEKSYSYFICTKHFVDGAPSQRYPDPAFAEATSASNRQPVQGMVKPSRSSPKKGSTLCTEPSRKRARKTLAVSEPAMGESQELEVVAEKSSSCVNASVSTPTSHQKRADSSGLDMLAAASDCQRKQLELEALKRKVEQLKAQIAQERLNHEALQRELQHCKHGQARWTADKIKNQMSYYTGFTYDDFKKILKFLAPTDKVPFTTTRKLEKAVDALSLEQQFLLVMIKLRQNFDFMHLATLFQITATEGGQLFKAWINYMCFRFGEIPSWPDREILIENMPEKFRQDFPLTVAILDSTKIKFKKTRALKMKCQSLFCSDYMSCTTLKGLVAVDPRGAVMFTSILFSGSISDKDICKRSGLLEQLNLLMQSGKLQPGDGIMVDKDFHIVEEIEQLGLKLWIPPSASLETPMSAADVAQTRKIAEHRFVVEKVIGRAKKFKIIKDKVSLNLFPSINKIWLCCCFLTNFMPCLKEK